MNSWVSFLSLTSLLLLEVLQCKLLFCMMLLLGGQCGRLLSYALANMRARSSALQQGLVL